MIWVEPGSFTMGSPTTEAGRQTNETQHEVTLTKGFYLGKYEVTQAQYEAVMTGNSDGLSATPSNMAEQR
jgi:formylglycine-generating enzyme required for sulfatase activity